MTIPCWMFHKLILMVGNVVKVNLAAIIVITFRWLKVLLIKKLLSENWTDFSTESPY